MCRCRALGDKVPIGRAAHPAGSGFNGARPTNSAIARVQATQTACGVVDGLLQDCSSVCGVPRAFLMYPCSVHAHAYVHVVLCKTQRPQRQRNARRQRMLTCRWTLWRVCTGEDAKSSWAVTHLSYRVQRASKKGRVRLRRPSTNKLEKHEHERGKSKAIIAKEAPAPSRPVRTSSATAWRRHPVSQPMSRAPISAQSALQRPLVAHRPSASARAASHSLQLNATASTGVM